MTTAVEEDAKVTTYPHHEFRDARGIRLYVDATVIYGAVWGNTVETVEAVVTGFHADNERVQVRAIRRSYRDRHIFTGERNNQSLVHAHKLMVVEKLPYSMVPTRSELINQRRILDVQEKKQ